MRIASAKPQRSLVTRKPLPICTVGNIPKQFVSKVIAGAESIPEKLTSELRSHGCRIVVCKRLLEEFPELRDEPLDVGLDETERRSWDNIDAVGGLVIGIAEKYIDPDTNKTQTQDDPEEATRHEIGHSINYYIGDGSEWKWISNKTQFREDYKRDVEKLSVAARRNLFYFLQNNPVSGRDEVFAEVLANLCGGGCQSHNTGYSDQYFLRCFSNVRAYIERNILKDK